MSLKLCVIRALVGLNVICKSTGVSPSVGVALHIVSVVMIMVMVMMTCRSGETQSQREESIAWWGGVIKPSFMS